MKLSYIVVSLIAILGWNVFLIQRDLNLFKAYDAYSHSNQK